MGCPEELTLQLGTILATNIVIGQTREVLLPLINFQVQRALNASCNWGKKEKRVLWKWETERSLASYAGTIDEYSELGQTDFPPS